MREGYLTLFKDFYYSYGYPKQRGKETRLIGSESLEKNLKSSAREKNEKKGIKNRINFNKNGVKSRVNPDPGQLYPDPQPGTHLAGQKVR